MFTVWGGGEVSLGFGQDPGTEHPELGCLGLERFSSPSQPGSLLLWTQLCPPWGWGLEGLLNPSQHLVDIPSGKSSNSYWGAKFWSQGPGCAQVQLCCCPVFGQNITNLLDCGEGGLSNPRNLKNVFEDKTSCFAVWGFCCRLLPSICRLWSASLYLSSLYKTILFSAELAVGFALFLNKAGSLGTWCLLESLSDNIERFSVKMQLKNNLKIQQCVQGWLQKPKRSVSLLGNLGLKSAVMWISKWQVLFSLHYSCSEYLLRLPRNKSFSRLTMSRQTLCVYTKCWRIYK